MKFKENKMSKMFRLSKDEDKKLQRKSIEINKVLIKMEKAPMKDSELLHQILCDAIDKIQVTKNGAITIEE